jgi:diguanylate cyclase (GGDEF)-like protein
MRDWVAHHMSRFLVASPLALASGLTILCLPAIAALAWSFTGYWEHQRVAQALQRQTLQIARQLNDAEFDIEVVFSQARSITTWVAEEGNALSAIQKPADVADENLFLDSVARSFGLDLIYIMDAVGLSVAASNFDTPSNTVGRNYSDREHFQAAITGVPGRQFAVGRTTRAPGFFFSMPVRQAEKVVGTVGIKIDQARLQHTVRIPGALISDEYGIVVLSENPKYLLNALPDATVMQLSEQQRMSRYARTGFTPLPLQSARLAHMPDIMLLDTRPVLLGERALIDAGLTITMASDFAALHEASDQRREIFSLFCIAGTGLVWGLWIAILYILRARHYRCSLENLNIQLSRLNAELHEQATHDFLTNCLNRRAFSALLHSELERVRRYGGSLSLVVLDIDHFKRINDSRGHAIGDVALKFLVDTLNSQLRRADTLGRIGGEEFAILMPSTALGEAVQVIDRMREQQATLAVPGQEPPLLMTFSAGVSEWRPGVSEHALLNAADQAMYAAKEAGRNRVLSRAA